MSTFHAALRALSLATGLLLAAMAVSSLVVAAFGSDSVNLGRMAVTMSIVLGLLSTPFLTWPFWPRVARWCTGLLLCALGVAMCVQVFSGPSTGPGPQVLVVTFCLLLAVRIVLTWRMRSGPRRKA